MLTDRTLPVSPLRRTTKPVNVHADLLEHIAPYYHHPGKIRLTATLLDADRCLLATHTLAIAQPSSRRIDCKRLLSLLPSVPQARYIVLAHNTPGLNVPLPLTADNALTETIAHFWNVCHARGLLLVDYLVLGDERYLRASAVQVRGLHLLLGGFWK